MNQLKNQIENDIPWWSEDYGFFGDFYMKGDDSFEGYLIEKNQCLSERTKEEAQGVVNLLSLPKGARILDCPCGYGRHSIELAKIGMKLTGSDINAAHLEKAREEASKENLDLRFVQENMLELKYDKKFDAVINMFYSFGFFETDEENERVLKNFYDVLKPGGKFLMHTDVNIPRIISRQYKEDEKRNLKNGGTLRIIDKYNPKTKRIDGIWVITDQSGKEIKKDYSVRVYTKEEFVDICKKVGFRSCKSYSDWTGKAYSPESEDMIIVATK